MYENYTVRTADAFPWQTEPDHNLFDWLKDREINPPLDTLKQKELVKKVGETLVKEVEKKSIASGLWKWAEPDD